MVSGYAHGDEVDLDALAMRAAAGDREALEDAAGRSIQPRVRRICGRMLLYPQDAEEATQDALLLVATKIHTLRGPQQVHHLAARGGLQQRPLDVPDPQAARRRAAHRRDARCTPTRAPPA